MQNFIQLNKQDNVVIALKNFNEGDIITLDGEVIQLLSGIQFGHKIAIRDIPVTAKVLKYGQIIGSATQDIQPGEHVHSHNLKTDYEIARP